MPKNTEKITDGPKSISYIQLGLMASFFILGVLSLLIYQNVASEKITLGTTEIINFVFSVALSTASIILAVNAISLGKASEQAMIERSDESIKLQNEVFRLTNEALNRIQSSTGVTEKRIEDIISGRAGDISSKIAGALDESGITMRNKNLIEQEIRKSLLKEVAASTTSDAENAAEQEERRRRSIAQKKYDQYITDIQIKLSNDKELAAVKFGHGSFNGVGNELFDCVYRWNNKLIGITILESEPEQLEHTNNLLSSGEYLKTLAIEAKSYYKIFIISEVDGYRAILQENFQLYNSEIVDKFNYLYGKSEEVAQSIIKDIKE